MSRSSVKLSEIPCGTHLVAPTMATPIKGADDLPIVTKEGAIGLRIRFGETVNGFSTDHDFWVPSPQYGKLCRSMGIDTAKPLREQILGKRIWICVKEVKSMDGEKHVGSRFEIFDFIKCEDPERMPLVSGDPSQHPKGIPMGVFVEYEQVDNISAIEALIPIENEINMLELKKQQKILLAKSIIEQGEKKDMSSLNQKNIEKDPFEEELAQITPGESEDNATIKDDDWDSL